MNCKIRCKLCVINNVSVYTLTSGRVISLGNNNPPAEIAVHVDINLSAQRVKWKAKLFSFGFCIVCPSMVYGFWLLLSLYFTVVLCLSSSCVLCTQSCQWIVHFVIALSVFSNTYFNTKILFVHNIYSFLFIYSLSNRLVKQHNTKTNTALQWNIKRGVIVIYWLIDWLIDWWSNVQRAVFQQYVGREQVQ